MPCTVPTPLPQVQQVVYPLLTFAVTSSGPEAEVLLEEGFKLWLVLLGAAPQVIIF